jgi:hypothetical protein
VDRAQQTERLLPVPYFLVTFTDTDSATQERRECTLDAEEFRRRYLQHVLPPGQHRVRYFGWMHPSAKRRRLIVEILLAVPLVVRPKVEAPEPWHLRCPPCRTPSRTSPLKIQFPSSESSFLPANRPKSRSKLCRQGWLTAVWRWKIHGCVSLAN